MIDLFVVSLFVIIVFIAILTVGTYLYTEKPKTQEQVQYTPPSGYVNIPFDPSHPRYPVTHYDSLSDSSSSYSASPNTYSSLDFSSYDAGDTSGCSTDSSSGCDSGGSCGGCE